LIIDDVRTNNERSDERAIRVSSSGIPLTIAPPGPPRPITTPSMSGIADWSDHYIPVPVADADVVADDGATAFVAVAPTIDVLIVDVVDEIEEADGVDDTFVVCNDGADEDVDA
jgi:hypothetical protein